MIVKDEFLERRRVELAIGAELKRHLRHPIGLTSGVDSKSVRFALREAHHSVEQRRGEQKQCAENQRQQRQSGGIGNAAHSPFVAPAPERCIKQNSSKRESDEYENSEIGQQLRAVIKNVMAHLVCHHQSYLREWSLLEQMVIERDPRRAEEP